MKAIVTIIREFKIYGFVTKINCVFEKYTPINLYVCNHLSIFMCSKRNDKPTLIKVGFVYSIII